MNIIFAVTGQAVAANRRCIFALGRGLFVATFTKHLDVCTIQRVLGSLVVVEIPQAPGSGVMATLATHAQLLFVLVFLLMARKTISGRILEARRLMATLAGRGHMASSKRKPRQRMVEFLNLPGLVTVTRLARGAGLTFMLVVFLVAAVTFQRCLAQAAQILVAGHTLDSRLGMSIAQCKLGSIMAEAPGSGLPVTFRMAISTFFAQSGVVFVVLLVASDAILGCFLEHRAFVAILAFHLAVLAQ